jgi:cobyrinic acid a,c-diamide synthase
LYIGGGYPELHAGALQANDSLRSDIRGFARAGGVVYGECGGLMFLSQGLYTSPDVPRFEMCGVLELDVRMTPHMKVFL